jgi:hypothetical protein
MLSKSTHPGTPCCINTNYARMGKKTKMQAITTPNSISFKDDEGADARPLTS